MKMEYSSSWGSDIPNEEPHLKAEESEEVSQPSEDHTREEVECLTAERDDLRAQLSGQQDEVQCQKERHAQLWRLNCKQLQELDKTLEDKEAQIRTVLKRIQQLKAGSHQPTAAVLPPTQNHSNQLINYW